MIDALKQFERNPVGLLQALNYDIYEVNQMSKDNFLDLFPSLTDNELIKFQENIYLDQLVDIKLIGFFSALNEVHLFQFGETQHIVDKLTFWLIQMPETQPELHKRSVLSKITREINQKFETVPAILFFQYGDFLTISIVQRRLHKKVC